MVGSDKTLVALNKESEIFAQVNAWRAENTYILKNQT